MNSQINTNKSDITALKGLVGETAVATQISTAIDEALKSGENDKYALASDLTAANGKITALEEKVGEKAVATQITEAIDGALKVDGADKYALASHEHEIADVKGLQTLLDNKAAAADVTTLQSDVTALEGKAHEHENKTVLDAIAQTDIDKWNSAQANVIEKITVGGTEVSPSEKTVAIPAATAEVLGVVKVDNTSIESNAGVIGVKAVGVSKLFVEEGTELVLNGGKA